MFKDKSLFWTAVGLKPSFAFADMFGKLDLLVFRAAVKHRDVSAGR